MSPKILKTTALIILAAAVIGLVVWKLTSQTSPIPKSINQKASFTIFYPQAQVKGLTRLGKTVAYNNANNALSYTVLVNNKQVVISEQSTPDVFSQSGVYPYKLDQAHEYDSFSSAAGEVALTKPDGLGGQTVAWVNAKGTLTLARGLQSLSKSQWQLLFNNLQTIQ